LYGKSILNFLILPFTLLAGLLLRPP